MNEADEVYHKDDTRRKTMGIIVRYKGKRRGIKVFDVAWIGAGKAPTEHLETELVVGETRRGGNHIRGTVTGTVIQTTGDISGGIYFNR